MRIKHEWQTTRNRTASVSCSGPSLDVPGTVKIDVPEDPLQSERMTMALEILRQAEEIRRLKKVCATQAAVIDNSIESDRIGVNVNAITGAKLRLFWASEGDLSWLDEDAAVPEIRKIWDRTSSHSRAPSR